MRYRSSLLWLALSMTALAAAPMEPGRAPGSAKPIRGLAAAGARIAAAQAPVLPSQIALAKGAPVPGNADAIAGEVLVRFRPGRAQAAMARIQGAGGPRVRGARRFRSIDWYQVQVEGTADVAQIVAQYRESPDVLYAEPNYRMHALGQAIPNDPRFSELWGMHNVGQTGGTADADIDAPEAWYDVNSTDVLVAVIDTGADYSHPDLAANMWRNSGEIEGNGVDDDHNGFVDDARGWDFLNNDNNPMDDHSHGTHCSGTIGAIGNNGVGVAGVCWNVKIMPVKFLGADGSGPLSAAISAIDYAVRMGAKVLSNSWGGGAYSQSLYDAISAANQAGALFVAAAGNEGSNNDTSPSYPCGYELPNVISVAATTNGDQLASFSNYGAAAVDLGAPGVSILSTTPGGSYGTMSGTSMATPHVSGACALVWGAAGLATPPSVVKSAILDGCDRVAGLAGKCITGGRLNLPSSIAIVASGRHLGVASPNGGEGFEAGTAAPIAWRAYGGAWQSGDTVKLEYSANGGAAWTPVPGGGAVNYRDGTYDWPTAGLSPGGGYRVRITANADATVTDTSDADFTLTGPLERFLFEMAPSQVDGRIVMGTCRVTAKDAAGRTISTFGTRNTTGRFPVAVTAPGVTITGLSGGGSALDAANFVEGVADLAKLGMVVSVPATPVTAAFTAQSADGKAGVSGDVTISTLPDYFTQYFDTEPFDLAGRAVMFVPDGSADFYAGYSFAITQLPSDPSGGIAVPLGDDTWSTVTLNGDQVSLYGQPFSTFYIGSNGFITFGGGDDKYAPSFAGHFGMRRISLLFDDLDPTAGQVTWKQLADRAVVTFNGVREYGSTSPNTFQVEMYYDGRIVLAYMSVSVQEALVGLSRGTGVPADFMESDLSAYPAPGDYQPSTFTLSGTVKTTMGTPLAGVTMTPSPSGSQVVTSSTGGYRITYLAPGTYTVRPSKAGYTFNPDSLTVTVGPDAVGQDFAATVYSISGAVTVGGTPLAGVVVTPSPSGSPGVTDAAGRYTIADLPNGTYTLTPSKGGFTFSPGARSVSVGPSAADKDFAAAAIVYDEDFETGDLSKWPWRTSTSYGWSVTADTAHGGRYSARSGAIGNNGTTFLEITLTRAVGSVSFHRRVSSEEGWDFLRFKIDGVEKVSWSGEQPWSTTPVSYPVAAGTHTYRWEYTKDWTTRVGSDTVWIDDIAFPPGNHSISGTVTNAGGQPMAGVTITPAPAGAAAVTDALGRYTLSDLAPDIYTLTPSLAGHTFTPETRTVTLATDASGQDFTDTTPTYSISGSVSQAGIGLQGVSIGFSPSGGAAVTGADGAYSLGGLPAGTYTLTPALAGYTFTPPSLQVTVGPAGATGQDFTAAAAPSDEDFETAGLAKWPWQSGGSASWSVVTGSAHGGAYAARSGAIGGSQTTFLEVTLTRAAGSVRFFRRVSSEAGQDVLRFKIDGVEQGSWSGEAAWATPAASYAVAAGSHTYRWEYAKDASTSAGSDAAWVDDITFPPPAFSIAGTVRNSGGAPLAGVTITPSPGGTPVVTNAQGQYTLTTLPAGSYTLTPSLVGRTFAPASRSVTVGPDAAGQDFTDATPTYSIGGTVRLGTAGLAGVTVTVSPGGAAAVTDANGAYTVAGLFAGTYTVTPTRTGYTFSPTSLTVAVGPSAAGKDFAATSVVCDEDFERGDLTRWPWTTGGYQRWAVASDSAHSGTYSAKAGPILNSQNTYLEVTLTRGAGNVSFYRRVSTEAGYDFLRFKIDGAEKASWSGEVAWSSPVQSYPVSAGTHTYRWEYTKDWATKEGADTVWIDDITFPPATYSISGTVTLAGGGGLSGVILSATPSGGSALTNAAGSYALAGLLSGTYTLTPVKPGYVFSPASLSVSVGPDATGKSFTATGAPARLAFSVQPSSVGVGAAITPAVQVAVQDANGTLVSGATNAVTVGLSGGLGTGALSGSTTVAAVGGIATFRDLAVDLPGAGYTLAASAAGLSGAVSSAFDVLAPRPDLLIKQAGEPASAYALDNVVQQTPAGDQVEVTAVNANTPALYQVKVENDGTAASTFVLKAAESPEPGWSVTYRNQAGTDITAAVRSDAGALTAALAPGGSEVITLTMVPTPAAAGATAKTALLSVRAAAADALPIDVVQATTWIFGSEQGDLLVKQAAEPDSAYGVNDEYQGMPAGAQVEGMAVNPRTHALYQVKVQNDGNLPCSFVLKGEESAETGWVVAYRRADGTDITAQASSAAGYATGTLDPGAGEVITIDAEPTALAAAGSSHTVVARLYHDAEAAGWYDAVQVTTWAFGSEQGDLLVKQDTEPDTAYGVNDEYQWLPGGAQVECVAVNPRTATLCRVKVENDGNVARSFALRVEETAEPGWSVVYRRQDGTEITAQVLSAGGYTTGVLPGGGSEVVTVEMTPGLSAEPGTSKTALLRLYRDGAAEGWYDAVQMTTWVFGMERADLLVKKEGEPDAAYALDNEYQWVPTGGQVQAIAVNQGQTATYQVKVENDGNIARPFVLKAQETGEPGWTLVYRTASGTDVTSEVRSAGGYTTPLLGAGQSEVLTVDVTPTTAPGGTPTTTFVRAYRDAASVDAWDVVQITTWEFGP